MIDIGLLTDITLFAEEILLGIIEMLLILRLYGRAYGNALLGKRRLYLYAASFVAIAASLMEVIILPAWPVTAPPVTVLLSFFFLRYFPSKRSKKILFSGILFVISCLWLIIADIMITPLQNKNYWGIDALLHLVFWLLLELVNRIGKYEETDIPFSLWILLLGIAISSAAALYTMFYFMINRDDPYAVTVEIPVMLALLFINLSLFVFFDRFSILIRDTKEKASLEQKLQMQETHYRELDMAHQQIRAIEHDMKNYLRTAAKLAEQEESNAELAAFLNGITGRINQIEKAVSTGNPYLDTVLNIKISELARESIRVDTKIQVPSRMELSFEQASGILGNLLDNAKEACLALPDPARWVRINIEYINHALFIRIENPLDRPIVWKDGLPVSTKNDPVMHGIGLKNVKRIIGETGTLGIETTPSSFVARIALYDL